MCELLQFEHATKKVIDKKRAYKNKKREGRIELMFYNHAYSTKKDFSCLSRYYSKNAKLTFHEPKVNQLQTEIKKKSAGSANYQINDPNMLLLNTFLVYFEIVRHLTKAQAIARRPCTKTTIKN